jgi:hypothetical protein
VITQIPIVDESSARAAVTEVTAELAPEHVTRAHHLVWYRVSTTPPGNARVSTRFRFTQLSSAVKNGVPPPTRTGTRPVSGAAADHSQ